MILILKAELCQKLDWSGLIQNSNTELQFNIELQWRVTVDSICIVTLLFQVVRLILDQLHNRLSGIFIDLIAELCDRYNDTPILVLLSKLPDKREMLNGDR